MNQTVTEPGLPWPANDAETLDYQPPPEFYERCEELAQLARQRAAAVEIEQAA